MSSAARHTAFDTAHPVVPALYFAGTSVLMMCALQPVYVGISLVAALLFSLCCRGLRATLAGLRWQLPLLALVCLANPLFSASGSTVVCRIGPVAVYAEALAFGACMGALMVSVVVWLECASRVLTQDRLLAVSGRVLPTVSLMVSMTAQLVPQLMRRAQTVRQVEAACTAARKCETGSGLKSHSRLGTMLLTWSLEDSLERSDAMRARGWGASPRRTSYRTWRFRAGDAVALVVIGLLLAFDAFLAAVARSQFHFYPTMPRLVAWWGYVPYIVLLLVPTVLDLCQRALWR